MSMELPKPIAAYFAATNTHDIDAMLVPFAETATVKDEGQQRDGLAAIREWMDGTVRKYGFTVVVIGAADEGGRTVVTARVSGSFPGSPVQLRYDGCADLAPPKLVGDHCLCRGEGRAA